jgi:hypothetical protein
MLKNLCNSISWPLQPFAVGQRSYAPWLAAFDVTWLCVQTPRSALGWVKNPWVSHKVKVKQSRYTPWRRLGERKYSSYSFSTSALDGGEWSASRPGRAFPPGERTPGTHCTGGWVGPRAGLDTEARGKILCPRRGSNPDLPVVQPVVRHYTAWATPAPLGLS